MLGPLLFSVVRQSFAKTLGRKAIEVAVTAAAGAIGTAVATGIINSARKKHQESCADVPQGRLPMQRNGFVYN